MAIPYMGSKRKLAPAIIDHIIENNPNAKYFFDLFGGGAAVSIEALKRKRFTRVVYNELNTAICELLKKIQKDGVTDEFFQWIDRKTYFNLKDGNDWRAGLVQTCWSFGNDQKSHLYGKHIEEVKKQAHFFLMMSGYNRTMQTRKNLIKEFNKNNEIKKRFDLEHLERLQHLEQLEKLQHLHLERLEIFNKSYNEIEINTPVNETVIYCDPPYYGTGKYKEKSFCHDEFYRWVSENPYKIYVSEYQSPIFEVNRWVHRSTLSATNNSKYTTEILFCNRDDDLRQYLFASPSPPVAEIKSGESNAKSIQNPGVGITHNSGYYWRRANHNEPENR